MTDFKRVAIIGAGGGIGAGFIDHLSLSAEHIYAFSRAAKTDPRDNVSSHEIDIHDENSLESAAQHASQDGPLDLVIVTVGTLHGDAYKPEKSLRDFSHENFEMLFKVNTIGPALVAKYFVPCLSKERLSVFAALSARIGSISDNRIGGWTSYRASKAALNMVIKNISIETARSNKQAIIAGLHPGTVDTELSKPYQAGVRPEKLFTPNTSTQKMLEVIYGLTPECSGKCFAWDGQEITP